VQSEREKRALSMVREMDNERFFICTNERDCEAVCPKGNFIRKIARLNPEFLGASVFSDEQY